MSFDSPIGYGTQTNPATQLIPVQQVVSNPEYTQAQNDPHDIAVLLLNAADTAGIVPANLPPAGLLEELAKSGGFDASPVTNVGYGVQNRVVGGGVPFFQDVNPIPRMYSFSSFNALNKAYIRYSQNPATGDGGACFGDSGGPQFFTFEGTTYIVSITITGDAVCRATNVAYRLDTASARSFLSAYVSLPYKPGRGNEPRTGGQRDAQITNWMAAGVVHGRYDNRRRPESTWPRADASGAARDRRQMVRNLEQLQPREGDDATKRNL